MQSVDGEYWSFELIHIFYRVALGIGAASFASGASKDIAESPTALPERPKTSSYSEQLDFEYQR
jgi:hypothetical protein